MWQLTIHKTPLNMSVVWIYSCNPHILQIVIQTMKCVHPLAEDDLPLGGVRSRLAKSARELANYVLPLAQSIYHLAHYVTLFAKYVFHLADYVYQLAEYVLQQRNCVFKPAN